METIFQLIIRRESFVCSFSLEEWLSSHISWAISSKSFATTKREWVLSTKAVTSTPGSSSSKDSNKTSNNPASKRSKPNSSMSGPKTGFLASILMAPTWKIYHHRSGKRLWLSICFLTSSRNSIGFLEFRPRTKQDLCMTWPLALCQECLSQRAKTESSMTRKKKLPRCTSSKTVSSTFATVWLPTVSQTNSIRGQDPKLDHELSCNYWWSLRSKWLQESIYLYGTSQTNDSVCPKEKVPTRKSTDQVSRHYKNIARRLCKTLQEVDISSS